MIDRDGNYEPGVPVSSRKVALGLLRTAMADEFAEFRSGQWEAIEAIASKRGRVLCVQRTGWGKSMVYFVAAKLLRLQVRGRPLSSRRYWP